MAFVQGLMLAAATQPGSPAPKTGRNCQKKPSERCSLYWTTLTPDGWRVPPQKSSVEVPDSCERPLKLA